MQHQEIFTRLSQMYPEETIYRITMTQVMSSLVDRLGEEALTLSTSDMGLARDEVKIAIDHHLDDREYINIGLDAWDIVRNL